MQPHRRGLNKHQIQEESSLAEDAKRTRDTSKIEALILCPDCKVEMRLFGIEAESAVGDVFSFEWVSCGRIEGRGVLVSVAYTP